MDRYSHRPDQIYYTATDGPATAAVGVGHNDGAWATGRSPQRRLNSGHHRRPRQCGGRLDNRLHSVHDGGNARTMGHFVQTMSAASSRSSPAIFATETMTPGGGIDTDLPESGNGSTATSAATISPPTSTRRLPALQHGVTCLTKWFGGARRRISARLPHTAHHDAALDRRGLDLGPQRRKPAGRFARATTAAAAR